MADAAALASRMLGGTLVTKQTGAEGKPVNTLMVAKKMTLSAEKYFALTLDRKTAGPIAIACSQGGTSIEDLAEEFPDRIIRVPVDPIKGITDADAQAIVKGLGCTCDKADAVEQVKAMYKARAPRARAAARQR